MKEKNYTKWHKKNWKIVVICVIIISTNYKLLVRLVWNITNLIFYRNLTRNVRYILDKIWYNANGG